MRRHIRTAGSVLLAAAILPGLLAPGCKDEPARGAAFVVATTAVIGALTTEVAGPDMQVEVLVAAGVDPHDYELTARDVKALGRARAVLRNGIGLDGFLDRAVEGDGGVVPVTVTTGIDLRRSASGEEDPHVWQDPVTVTLMVTNIAEALAAADPAHAQDYRRRATAYNGRLAEVDREIRLLVESIPVANRKIVTNHDSLGYFAARYGLTVVGTVIPGTSTQAEPSARDLATLQDTIRREGVKAIFAESSLDPKVARQIAADAGVIIVTDLYGDSPGPPGSGAETVDGMILANARKIAEALR